MFSNIDTKGKHKANKTHNWVWETPRSKISYDLRPITLNYDMMMMANEENRVNTKNVRTQNVVTMEEIEQSAV